MPGIKEALIDLEGLEAEAVDTANQQPAQAPVSAEPKQPTAQAEGGEAAKQPATETPEKQYYTAEEMRNLDPTKVDTSRIPPEQLPFYKSLYANWNRKYEELAEERKSLGQPMPPRTPDEAFARDPMGFMYSLDMLLMQKKRELLGVNEYESEETAKNALRLKSDINQLEEGKITYSYKYGETVNRLNAENRLMNDYFTELLREIPDYNDRWQDLTDFAYELGYTREELMRQSDPRVVGKNAAIKNVKLLNSHFGKMYPERALKGKLDKTATKTAKPGTGFDDSGQGSLRLKAAHDRMVKEGTTEATTEYLTVKKEEALKQRK